MNISIIMNIINVVGNYIGVFILHAGVAGVAYPFSHFTYFCCSGNDGLIHEKRSDDLCRDQACVELELEYGQTYLPNRDPK